MMPDVVMEITSTIEEGKIFKTTNQGVIHRDQQPVATIRNRVVCKTSTTTLVRARGYNLLLKINSSGVVEDHIDVDTHRQEDTVTAILILT